MMSTIEYAKKDLYLQNEISLPRWERIALLSILGYEAAGCLAGGFLLAAAPDGRLMMQQPIAKLQQQFNTL